MPAPSVGGKTGGVPVEESRPDEAAIRRALAECMTVNDIDDAMGWPLGTARRRRWRSPARGGLPNADAEFAGIAVWFRSTINVWQQSAPTLRRRTTTTEPSEPDLPATLDQEVPADTPNRPEPEGRDEQITGRGTGSTRPDPDLNPDLDLDPDTGLDTDGAEGPDPTEPVPTGEEDGQGVAQTRAASFDPHVGAASEPTPVLDAASAVTSGFDVAVGQKVVAEVHGDWRDAVVAHRDRTTVVVEYQINDSPLGARRQRVGTDRVRLPSSD